MGPDDTAGTDELLQVNLTGLRRVAAAIADLSAAIAGAARVAGMDDGPNLEAAIAGMPAETRRAVGAAPVAGTEGPRTERARMEVARTEATASVAAAGVVAATEAELHSIAAATAAFADLLVEAAERYESTDARVSARFS